MHNAPGRLPIESAMVALTEWHTFCLQALAMLTNLQTLELFTGPEIGSGQQTGLTGLCADISCLTRLTRLSLINEIRFNTLPLQLSALCRYVDAHGDFVAISTMGMLFYVSHCQPDCAVLPCSLCELEAVDCMLERLPSFLSHLTSLSLLVVQNQEDTCAALPST